MMTECSRCGEEKECEFIKDPFIKEVCSDDPDFNCEPLWWCEKCADERRDDI